MVAGHHLLVQVMAKQGGRVAASLVPHFAQSPCHLYPIRQTMAQYLPHHRYYHAK